MQRMPQTASSIDSSGFDTVLLRIGAWGTAAALALGTFVYIAQTDAGTARLQIALADAVMSDGLPAVPATTTLSEASPTAFAALEAKLDRLNADRSRLETKLATLEPRLATLEHGLEDVTGSVRRKDEKVEIKPFAPPFIQPPIIPSISTLPPATTIAAIPAEHAASETATKAAEPEPVAEPAAPAEAAPEAPPMPRARPATRPAAEYGVELGTAPNMDALRTRWVSVKANFGPMLVGLSPIAVKDKRPGSAQLRLMAGPLKNMAAARELCAKFVAANGYCWPMKVDAIDVVQR